MPPMPMAGSQPRLTENRMTSSSASQKFGIETPSSASTMLTLSGQRFW